MNYRAWLMRSTILYAPDGGGGGGGDGSGDGAQFIDLGEGKGPSDEQVGTARAFLEKNTENFDPKTLEGKSPQDVWNLARVREGEIRSKSDPLKGTPWEGLKVPAKFIKDGKVQAADLLNGYTNLETAQFRRREEVRAEAAAQILEEAKKAAPATPGDYTQPEKLKIGDREVTVIANDPMLTYIKGVAHELHMPQERFNKVIEGYVGALIESMPKWSDQVEALGGESIAEKREARVDGFLRGNLSAENYAFFSSMPSTARSIMAIEELMTLTGAPAYVPDQDEIPGDTMTRAQLKEMQSDPRYTGEGRPAGPDKAFVAKVRAGWEKLSKSKS